MLTAASALVSQTGYEQIEQTAREAGEKARQSAAASLCQLFGSGPDGQVTVQGDVDILRRLAETREAKPLRRV